MARVGAGSQPARDRGARRLGCEPGTNRGALRRPGRRGPRRARARGRGGAGRGAERPARMRRLLVLCYFYPPLAGGGVHRVLGFTRHLPRHGWECTVVCADRGDYWVEDESLLARVPRDTEVIRVRGGSALSAWLGLVRGVGGRRSTRTFAGLRKLSDWWLMPDSYAGWSARAAAVAERRARAGGFHAMLSSSPPDSVHLAGRAVHRRTGLPWVADFRDPWIG